MCLMHVYGTIADAPCSGVQRMDYSRTLYPVQYYIGIRAVKNSLTGSFIGDSLSHMLECIPHMPLGRPTC
jgi:hypothetical protein